MVHGGEFLMASAWSAKGFLSSGAKKDGRRHPKADAIPQVVDASGVGKRWSTGTNSSDEDEFEMVLCDSGDSRLEAETISLAQYKASERSFEEWPPPNPLVLVAEAPVQLLRDGSGEARSRARELYLRWRLILAREPPLLDRAPRVLRGALDIVMHKGCPNQFRKDVWLALADAPAAATTDYLGMISVLRANLAQHSLQAPASLSCLCSRGRASSSPLFAAGMPLTEDGERAVCCLLSALSGVWSGQRWQGSGSEVGATAGLATPAGGGCSVQGGGGGEGGSSCLLLQVRSRVKLCMENRESGY